MNSVSEEKQEVYMLKESSTLWQRYSAVYSYRYSRDFECVNSYWEKGQSADFIEMRRMFVDQIVDRPDKNYLAGRWKAAIFDSVGEYVVIGTAFVLNLMPRGPLVTAPFAHHGGDQCEDTGVHESLHIPDLTYDHLEDWRWGQDAPYLAWREKKDGTHGCTVPGGFRSSWWKGEAPAGVQSCEFTPHGIFVLYPYTTKVIESYGLKFLPHPWKSPSEYTTQPEGIVILTMKGEIRCKNMPTVDVEENGVVWEIGYEGSKTHYLRPRGKGPQPKEYLYKYVSLKHICLPAANYTISTRVTGPVKATAFEDNKLVIESGIRKGPITKVVTGDIARYTSGSHTISGHKDAPPPSLYLFSVAQTSRFGAKACYFEQGRPVLFKDGTKKWDFIGGKIDPGDASTRHALLREIREETGVDYKGKITPMGMHYGPEWSTALFIIEKFSPRKGRFAVWGEEQNVVPWMPQYINHILKYEEKPISTYSHIELGLTLLGAAVFRDIVTLQDNRKQCHLKIVKGSVIVGATQSAHALFAFKQFLQLRTKNRSDFVQQLRSQYRLEKLKPPDPYQVQRNLSILEGYITEGEPTYQIQVSIGSDEEKLSEAF